MMVSPRKLAAAAASASSSAASASSHAASAASGGTKIPAQEEGGGRAAASSRSSWAAKRSPAEGKAGSGAARGNGAEKEEEELAPPAPPPPLPPRVGWSKRQLSPYLQEPLATKYLHGSPITCASRVSCEKEQFWPRVHSPRAKKWQGRTIRGGRRRSNRVERNDLFRPFFSALSFAGQACSIVQKLERERERA